MIIMKKNLFELVGSKILTILEEKKLTQQYLADQLNVSKQVLNKIIKGQKLINIAEISSISKALGVSVEDLLEVDDSQEQLPKFSFMGRINNPKTREKVTLLKEVIDEILYLEEYADVSGKGIQHS